MDKEDFSYYIHVSIYPLYVLNISQEKVENKTIDGKRINSKKTS